MQELAVDRIGDDPDQGVRMLSLMAAEWVRR